MHKFFTVVISLFIRLTSSRILFDCFLLIVLSMPDVLFCSITNYDSTSCYSDNPLTLRHLIPA